MFAQEAIEATRAERMASWRGTRLEGLLWAALSVAIFSGWFVVTRFSVTHELQVWDVTSLRRGRRPPRPGGPASRRAPSHVRMG